MTPQQWLIAGQFFTFKNWRIFYRDSGEHAKPVLLLVHGFPTSSHDWHVLWNQFGLWL